MRRPLSFSAIGSSVCISRPRGMNRFVFFVNLPLICSNYMPINDDNLLKRLAHGDEQALRAIVERYHGKLLQIAVQILR